MTANPYRSKHAVTIAGTRHALDEPFFVLATENPIEMEGTYPLPEAQLDRFLLKVLVPSPGEDDLTVVLEFEPGAESDATGESLYPILRHFLDTTEGLATVAESSVAK